MFNFSKKLSAVFLTCSVIGTAHAAEEVKIGVILPLSGPFSTVGKQMLDGINLYMSRYGDTAGNRKVTLVIKDDTGIAPDLSKRVAQELLVNDKVDILAGFGFTPSAFAVAPLATTS